MMINSYTAYYASSNDLDTNISPLNIVDVKKSYYEKQILNGINLNIESGKIFGLIGLNGVGKTTLIKIIVGLHQQDSGHIKIFGHDSNSLAAKKHMIYLPEKFYPSNLLKGKEFLKFTLETSGTKFNIETAKHYANKFKLNPSYLDKKISSYSKGMSQKLGLMLVLMSNSRLMILDEPMSGLDSSARIILKQQMIECKKQQKTVVFTSHIISDVEEICDYIGVMHNGTIIFCDTTDKFRKLYSDVNEKNENIENIFLRSIGIYT